MNSIFTTSKCLSRQQIQDYLSSQTAPTTLREIENHLLDCPLCATAVEGFAQQADVPAAIRQTEQLDYANRTVKTRLLKPLKAVASIAALLAVGVGAGWWMMNSEDANQVFTQHFTTYENDVILSLRSNDQPTEYATEQNPLQPALEAYDRRDFQQSIQLLQAHLEKRPNDAVATYYLGLSYLEEGALAQAANYLKTARISSSRYRDAATWYLALTQLKLEDLESAKKLLNQLTQAKDELYAKRATKLLEEL